MPQDNVPENLFKFRIRDFDQLVMVLALYEQEIEHTGILPDYQRSKNMVKRFLDQKMRNRNLEARHEKIASGLRSANRKVSQSVVRERRQSWRKLAAEERVKVTNGKQKADVSNS